MTCLWIHYWEKKMQHTPIKGTYFPKKNNWEKNVFSLVTSKFGDVFVLWGSAISRNSKNILSWFWLPLTLILFCRQPLFMFLFSDSCIFLLRYSFLKFGSIQNILWKNSLAWFPLHPPHSYFLIKERTLRHGKQVKFSKGIERKEWKDIMGK